MGVVTAALSSPSSPSSCSSAAECVSEAASSCTTSLCSSTAVVDDVTGRGASPGLALPARFILGPGLRGLGAREPGGRTLGLGSLPEVSAGGAGEASAASDVDLSPSTSSLSSAAVVAAVVVERPTLRLRLYLSAKVGLAKRLGDEAATPSEAADSVVEEGVAPVGARPLNLFPGVLLRDGLENGLDTGFSSSAPPSSPAGAGDAVVVDLRPYDPLPLPGAPLLLGVNLPLVGASDDGASVVVDEAPESGRRYLLRPDWDEDCGDPLPLPLNLFLPGAFSVVGAAVVVVVVTVVVGGSVVVVVEGTVVVVGCVVVVDSSVSCVVVDSSEEESSPSSVLTRLLALS